MVVGDVLEPDTASHLIRLVIVDDHAIVRHGLRLILEQEPSITFVGEASTAAEALDVVERTSPHVVLADLQLCPGDNTSGLHLCRDLSSRFPDVAVLILSTFVSDRLVVDALQSGAMGYVLKDVDAAVLADSIKAVREGRHALDSHTADALARSLATQGTSGAHLTLTDREQQVVRLVARGLSNKQIGSELFISATTVKFHLHNVCEKLGIQRRAGVVSEALRLGLL
ncbi:MAG: putative two-component system response regulator [Chloroflexi bacterium]|jgi:two-component system response regulator DevR|nr:putative two-component system response regulator [Chloroflexota bacterium]